MIDCVNVRYQQGEGEQKALRTDETVEITMRTAFRATKVRQYFKTEREETVGVNSCMMARAWVLRVDPPKHTAVG